MESNIWVGGGFGGGRVGLFFLRVLVASWFLGSSLLKGSRALRSFFIRFGWGSREGV